jgi:aryl-alcohol dehydrogenase-like predicted oxidoreductase
LEDQDALEIKKQRNKTSKMTGNDDRLRRYSPDNPMSEIFLDERNISIANEVIRISKELERTASQVALNWVRQRQQQQHLPIIIPIIGARTYSQVKDNLGCLDFNLTS